MRPFPTPRPSFDLLLERAVREGTSLVEADALRDTHWELGEDARFAEDPRFRPTPWGRWIPSAAYLANDALHARFVAEGTSRAPLRRALADLGRELGVTCAFCPGDPRFVVARDEVRLAASELGDAPAIDDDVQETERFTTHLPLHDLTVLAASLPAGEWGAGAVANHVEPLGWIRVDSGTHRANERTFVGRLVGESMDDGRSGLVDGAYVVFEAWPAGTRQGLDVLVRGSFHDPETGTYAVKRYEADVRDEEGRHHRIRLVSRNPDKARFPDIELDEDDGEDVVVIAKVVRVLRPSEYARLPREPRRPGRRDLRTAAHQEGLAEHAARFFARQPREAGGVDRPDPTRWTSRWVCLQADAGGTHLELGPLVGLWSFVRTVVGTSSVGGTTRLLASNARQRTTRLAASPASGAWTWAAEGFEDDPDVDLTAVDLAPLPHGRATVFLVAADGIGRPVAREADLSPGARYRVVVPPDVETPNALATAFGALADHWRLLELDLEAAPDDRTLELVAALDLSIGAPRPTLAPSVARPPDAWSENERGEPFAVFHAVAASTTSVWIDVRGHDAEAEGEARLFVTGTSGTTAIDMPGGRDTTVEIVDLAPDGYLATVLHRRTAVPPVHLPFRVEAGPPRSPAATWRLRIGGAVLDPHADGGSHATWRGDVRACSAADSGIEGPPGWHVDVGWRELAVQHLDQIVLDGAGQAPGEALLARIGTKAHDRSAGDVVLDFGELGTARLEHAARPSLDDLGTALRSLVQERGSIVATSTGAYLRLEPLWFEPVARVLGYDLESLAYQVEEDPPVHAAMRRMVVTERTPGGFRRSTKRLLVMLEHVDRDPSDPVRQWVSAACHRSDVEYALLSDGLAWAGYRRDGRLPLRVRRLDELDDEEALVDFLRDAAAVV